MMKQKHSYNITVILLLIALHLNGTLLCMEIEPSRNLNLKLLKTIPTEIVPIITRFAAPPQWWYHKKTYKSKQWVYGTYFDAQEKLVEITDLQGPRILQPQEKQFMCLTGHDPFPRSGYFDASEQHFLTTSSGKIAIFDRTTHKKIDHFEHPDAWVGSICLDSSKQFFATGAESFWLQHFYARIFNMETRQEMHAFRHNHYVNSVCFNQSGKLFVTVSGNRFVHTFAQYNDYTLWQLILRQTLHTWLCIKKPNKKINTVKKLLKKVSATSDLSYKKLITIWLTFPEYMQNAIWKTMHYKIQRYGKTTLKSLMNVV